jgi:beta-lactam-binding protein with PASTA domain
MQLLVRHGFQPQNVLMVPTPAPRGSFGKVVRTDPPAGRVVPDDAVVRVFIGTGGP